MGGPPREGRLLGSVARPPGCDPGGSALLRKGNDSAPSLRTGRTRTRIEVRQALARVSREKWGRISQAAGQAANTGTCFTPPRRSCTLEGLRPEVYLGEKFEPGSCWLTTERTWETASPDAKPGSMVGNEPSMRAPALSA